MATTSDPHPGSAIFLQRTGDHFHDFCAMVGMVTLSWAWCETAIAKMLEEIVEHTGPIEGFKKMPWGFTAQLDCFRKALNTKAELADLKAEGLQLASYADGLSTRRNAFIHSAVTPVPGEPVFLALQVAVMKGQYRSREDMLSVDDAAELNHYVATLSDSLSDLMGRVSDKLKGKPAEEEGEEEE